METIGQEDSNPPYLPDQPRRGETTVDQEDLEKLRQNYSDPPDPTIKNQQKLVLLYVMSELGIKSVRKRKM